MKRYTPCLAFMLAGCLNMPTPPVQITPAYVSGLNYEQFDCQRLYVESDSLSRRESQLVAAQEQRVRAANITPSDDGSLVVLTFDFMAKARIRFALHNQDAAALGAALQQHRSPASEGQDES